MSFKIIKYLSILDVCLFIVACILMVMTNAFNYLVLSVMSFLAIVSICIFIKALMYYFQEHSLERLLTALSNCAVFVISIAIVIPLTVIIL